MAIRDELRAASARIAEQLTELRREIESREDSLALARSELSSQETRLAEYHALVEQLGAGS